MPSHRTLRMAEAVREVVASAILHDVSDPRVRAVTVLHVEITGDMRNATVFVSVMGTEAEQKTAMQGLRSASGFLQARVAARLQTRFTPILAFKRDDSVKKSIAISQLIEDALAADAERIAREDGESESESESDSPLTEDAERPGRDRDESDLPE